MENKLIDEQIERFEREIQILEGCISVLKSEKLVKEIKNIEKKE